ncbi:hypothetical protein MTO96_014414 [Rhipicephalus appendiculatus]
MYATAPVLALEHSTRVGPNQCAGSRFRWRVLRHSAYRNDPHKPISEALVVPSEHLRAVARGVAEDLNNRQAQQNCTREAVFRLTFESGEDFLTTCLPRSSTWHSGGEASRLRCSGDALAEAEACRRSSWKRATLTCDGGGRRPAADCRAASSASSSVVAPLVHAAQAAPRQLGAGRGQPCYAARLLLRTGRRRWRLCRTTPATACGSVQNTGRG